MIRALSQCVKWIQTPNGKETSRGVEGSTLLGEIAGSFGDIPIFITFLIGFVALCGLSPEPILFWAGIASITAGIFFRIPIAVQPMKAIGALALASGLAAGDIWAAGVLMGVLLLVTARFNLFSRLYNLVPIGVIRGIQAGLGLWLIYRGMLLAGGGGSWFGVEGYVVTALVCSLCLILFLRRSFPVALLIVGVGTWVAFSRGLPIHFSLYRPELLISGESFDPVSLAALLSAQFPLTLANSLLATVLLAEDLHRRKISIDHLAAHIGLINLLFCPFGAMPICHGAGGLAAQTRFGGRTGWTSVIAGFVKLTAGLFCGTMILAFVRAFPLNLIGIMLAVGGVELLMQGLRVPTRLHKTVMILTSVVSLLTNTGIGFIAGWTAWSLFRFATRIVMPHDRA